MVDNTNFTVVNGVKIQKGAIKSVKFTENGGKQVRLKNDLVIDIGKSPKPDNAVIMTDYIDVDKEKQLSNPQYYNDKLKELERRNGEYETQTFCNNLPADVKIKGGKYADSIFLLDSSCKADFVGGNTDLIVYKGKTKINSDLSDGLYYGYDIEEDPLWVGMGELKNPSYYFNIEDYANDLHSSGHVDSAKLNNDILKILNAEEPRMYGSYLGEKSEKGVLSYKSKLATVVLFANKLNDLIKDNLGIDNQQYVDEITKEINSREIEDEDTNGVIFDPEELFPKLKHLILKIANCEK